ncbi:MULTISPECIES: antirestriction protein ArdA [unclassified Eubacterium (in: firmicutes)]|uniref:antirestriction protein ArdA n=1 Tax=unclassified Eubacterium (in: firmicutes) TaxID=2624479 RepID=UPI001FAA620F|nr:MULTISPECIES: antirestriction protein ArdA [unclassified Eubacterium (in: firmicutes)]
MSKYSHDHDCPFEVFITNLGKYNEGDLVGEWVKFPTSPEEIQKVFERIGIGSTDDFGQPYEEWFITDYDMYVEGLYDKLGEYESLDELNYLANVIEDMDDFDYERFCAAIETGEYTSSLDEIINLASNLDCYEYIPAANDYDLGYYYIEEAGIYDTSSLGNLGNYIDYESFGRDVRLEEGGVFARDGYVVGERDSFVRVYDGKSESIPEEYKVMSVPESDVDRSFTLGDYKVDVQLNSDNDFDYTIYKNGKHLDGGVLENENGLENIPDSVFDEIKKMHELEEHSPNNKVYGYVYDDNGMHGGKIEFEGTPENMAHFIMHNKMHPVVITDMVDQFIVSSTMGGFLDRVAYPALREEIIKEILPIQMGDKEAIDVAKQDVERDPISELAKDLDDFAYEFDFYGYQDAVDDRAEQIESLKADLESGNVEGLTDYLKEIIEDGEYMVPEATALLGRIEAIVPQKEEVKESKVSFYAAEDMEFHLGRYQENLTVEQAIEAYRQIEHPRGVKGIGVQSEDFDWGLVGGNTLNLSDLQYVPEVAANLQVQEAIKTIYQNMPELTVVGREEYLKNAEILLEDDYGMIDGIINNGTKEEKQAEKPSIIAEIKAAQKEAAEKKHEPKEKHHNKSHGQEL